MDADSLNSLEAQLSPETQIENVSSASPSRQQLSNLLEHYQAGRLDIAEKLAASMGPYAHQFRQMYQDADRLALLARQLKHDKVLDFILTKATVTEVAKDVPEQEQTDITGENDA